MSNPSVAGKLITALRYRDIERAAEWLIAAFGLALHTRIAGGDGRAEMIQLTWGGHLVLLLPVGTSDLDGLMRHPDEVGGATQSCYLVVDDIDAHHARATAAGARVVGGVRAFDNGGAGYICRDLEGHVWNFGTFDPSPAEQPGPTTAPTRVPRTARSLSMPALFALLAGLVAIAGWRVSLTYSSAEEQRLRAEVETATERAERAVQLLAAQTTELGQERSARDGAEREAQRSKEQAERERIARAGLERALRQREVESGEERRARTASEKTAGEEATRERAAREAAERSLEAMRKELASERIGRARAERAAQDGAEQLASERAAREAAEGKLKQAIDPPGDAQSAKRRVPPVARKTSAPQPIPALIP